MKTPTPSLAALPHPSQPLPSPFVAMAPWHRAILVTLVTAALAMVGIQQQIASVPVEGMPWVFLALVLNGVLLLLPIIFYRPNFGWFHPLGFVLFFALLGHLRRFDVYVSGLQWHAALPGWGTDHLTALVLKDLLLQAAGTVALYAGYVLGPTPGPLPIIFRTPAHLASKTVFTVAMATGIFAVYVQGRGGLISHMLSWASGRNEALAGAFYWQFLIQLGMLACLCWLTLDQRSTANPVFWGCTLASLTMIFLTGGSRSAVIYTMVMGLIAWLLREQKVDVVKIAAITLIGLFVLGTLGNLRNSTFSGTIDWGSLWGRSSASTAAETSTLNTGLTEISQRSSVYSGVFPILGLVPTQVDYLGGSSYLAALTLPVPRALWPQKPGLVAGMVGQTFFNTPVGMPPGPIGEAYWNFGLPGVLMVFTLFGAFQKWLAETYIRCQPQTGAIVPYVITLFLFSEPTGLAFVAWLMMLVPTLGWLVATGAVAWRPRPS